MEHKPRILIIEDEQDIRELLGERLSLAGFKVTTAVDGEEGFKKLGEAEPDLIILDLSMPRMGGLAFYNKICGRDGKPKFPILILTARQQMEEMFRNLEVAGFVTKPFEMEDLLHEILLIISKRSEKRAREEKMKHRKVLIVENDKAAFDRLVIAFANAGYTVSGAKTAFEALERTQREAPDVILIQLGLPDLPGDILGVKLKQTAMTADIRVILYVRPRDEFNFGLAKKMCEKVGISHLVDTDDPNDLIREVEQVLA